MSANFATRIAYANQHALIKVQNQPVESSRIRPHRIQNSLHDFGLSSEIDRLFADDANPEPGDESKNSQLAPRYTPRLDDEALRPMSEHLHPKLDAENVAAKGLSKADGIYDDASTDNFTRQVAAQTQTKNQDDVKRHRLQQLGEPLVDDKQTAEWKSQASENTTQQSSTNVEKEDAEESSVSALAKWFSSLAAAVDVVEHNAPAPDEATVHQVDVSNSVSKPESVREKSAARKQVDKWMQSVWDRALRDDLDEYFEQGLERVPLSFAVDDLGADTNVSSISNRDVGAPSVRTDNSDLDKMMSHLSSAV